MMFSALLVVNVCSFLVQPSFARGIPFDELGNDFLPEIGAMLQESLFRKVRPEPGHPREVRGWGIHEAFGQITGVSVNPDGNPVIIHRGPRIWTPKSFNASEHFQTNQPLQEDVVITLDRSSGDVLQTWGKGQFYLPHGITVDKDANTWVTDVGSHQVIKFSPEGTPVLTLGEKMQPGDDDNHFCKPTSVAVASNGEFFVSDGYCNGRILKFSADGQIMAKFGHLGDDGIFTSLVVPHGITLNEREDIMCVADREHSRTVCIDAGLRDHKNFGQQISQIEMPYNFRAFDVAFLGSDLFGIAGSTQESLSLGVTIDTKRGEVLDMWAPLQMFNNPHSIATDQKRHAIYVTEIGPNRVWKFLIDPPPSQF